LLAQRFSHPLRALLFVLLVGLATSSAAWAAPDGAAADISPQTRIEQASRTVAAVKRAVNDADAPETLKTLAERASQAQREAEASVAALQPELTQLDARIEQLGPAPEGGEDAGIARQRKLLDQQRSQVDADIKRGKLLAEEAKQANEAIEKMRAQQFGEQMGRKVASPLSPALWREFGEHVPDDLARFQSLYRQAHDALLKAAGKQGWGMPLLGASLALLMLFPLRIWLRHLGRRYAASERAPDGRLRRTGLAVWLLLVGTLLPGLAATVLVASLRAIDAIAPRLESVADMFVVATFVAAFIGAVAASLLVPSRPTWRLLDIDDVAAARLRRFAWGAASLTWLTMLLRDVNRAARTSAVGTVTLDGLIALTYVVLIMSMLATLAGLHRRRAAAAAQAEAENTSSGRSPRAPRSGWLIVARLGGYLSIFAALVATLLGYLNFAMFTAQQMVWGTVIVLATTLLTRFADDFALWLLAPESAAGRMLRLSTGLSASRLEQAGVLLSATSRLALVMLGITAFVAPFGNVSALYGWLERLSAGIKIGGNLLTPGSIISAVLVLVLGLALMRVVQRWLVDTYLPKTELDIGARNSISTVAHYLGIVLAALWALAALGIGFEKVALLASALSVGIGFGLQAITQNFVSGLILLAERPVKIGDWIKIGDQEGDIRRISVRSTEIQVGDRSTLIVPNSELITKTIRNMTMANALGRIQVQFSVPLGTDMGKLRALLLGIYAANETVLIDPAPSFFIDSISGGQVAVNSFAYVSSSRSVYGTRSEVLFALLEQTAVAGIPLSTPTDIHLVRDPPQT
jgi:small-conductance mechanosensitive channel